jgi:hypothetical protein
VCVVCVRALSRADLRLSRGMLVHVRCIIVSTQIWRECVQRSGRVRSGARDADVRKRKRSACVMCVRARGVRRRAMFCILDAMSSVRSAVEPPAPQVMSQNMGCAQREQATRQRAKKGNHDDGHASASAHSQDKMQRGRGHASAAAAGGARRAPHCAPRQRRGSRRSGGRAALPAVSRP